jgi:hypothetical protein
MLMSIGLGLAIVSVVVIVVYLATHHRQPMTPAGADLANVVSEATSSSWEALKRDLPSIVSAENAQLKADLAAANEQVAGLAAKLEATIAAHNADKAAVAARVSAAVTASPELPPSPVLPAVAVARAEDLAAVRAATAQISA